MQVGGFVGTFCGRDGQFRVVKRFAVTDAHFLKYIEIRLQYDLNMN